MRLPILGAIVLALGTGCATKTVVEIPAIPLESVPHFTAMDTIPACVEMAESGICQAWKVTRRQFEQLDRRDAEKDGYIAWLRRKIERHNEQSR